MIRRNFITDQQEDDSEEPEGEGDRTVDRESNKWEEFKTEWREAIRTTENTSAQQPDGIHNKTI